MRLIASSMLAGLIAVSAVAPAFADQRRGRGHDRDWNDRDYRDGYRDGRRDDWRDDRRDVEMTNLLRQRSADFFYDRHLLKRQCALEELAAVQAAA